MAGSRAQGTVVVRDGGWRATAVLGGDGRAGGGGAIPPVRPVLVEGVLEAARGEAAILLLLFLLRLLLLPLLGNTTFLPKIRVFLKHFETF